MPSPSKESSSEKVTAQINKAVDAAGGIPASDPGRANAVKLANQVQDSFRQDTPTQTAAMQVGDGPQPGPEGPQQPASAEEKRSAGSRKKGGRSASNVRHISSGGRRSASHSHRKAA